jgi:GDP-D-mannose dehydratase
MGKTALIVGVSGIVGGNLADHLIGEKDWTVYDVRPESTRDLPRSRDREWPPRLAFSSRREGL